MIAVRTIESTTERYVFSTARSFLEGEKDLKWITGVLLHSGLPREETLRVLEPLRTYGDHARARGLFAWLDSTGW